MNPFLIAQMRKRMAQHTLPSDGDPADYGWHFWLIGGFVLLRLRQAAP